MRRPLVEALKASRSQSLGATAVSTGTRPERRAEPECCRLPSTKVIPTSPSTSYVYGERHITVTFPRSADRLCRSLIHLPHVQVIGARSHGQGEPVGAAWSFLTFFHRSLGEPSFPTTPGAVRPKMNPPPFPPLHGALGRAAHGRRRALARAATALGSHDGALCVCLHRGACLGGLFRPQPSRPSRPTGGQQLVGQSRPMWPCLLFSIFDLFQSCCKIANFVQI
jgi:hypothetical protein